MRPFLLALVSLLVMTAGCAGVGVDLPGLSGATSDPVSTGPDPADPRAEGPGAGSVEAVRGEWDPYAFRVGETYRYDLAWSDGRTATFAWETAAVRDGNGDGDGTVTARVRYDDGTPFSQARTDAREDLYVGFAGTPAVVPLAAAVFSEGALNTAERRLVVGETYAFDALNGLGTVSVERADRYAGVDCAAVLVHVDERPTWEACLSPSHPLPVHVVTFDDAGEPAFEMTLVAVETTA
jgi:hypothetical protein